VFFLTVVSVFVALVVLRFEELTPVDFDWLDARFVPTDLFVVVLETGLLFTDVVVFDTGLLFTDVVVLDMGLLFTDVVVLETGLLFTDVVVLLDTLLF
jgi:hypothetical protein